MDEQDAKDVSADDLLTSSEPGWQRNRRTRLAGATDPQVKAWLRRIATSHAHLCYIVRLFGNPESAGGQSLEGETYAARAARGDRTLLHDAVGYVSEELAEMRAEIAAVMASAPPTSALPGSAEKVRIMVERAESGFDIFIDGDAATPLD